MFRKNYRDVSPDKLGFFARLNGLVNLYTSLGTWKARTEQYNYNLSTRLSDYTINAMLKDSPLCRKIVSAIVNDALRNELDFDNENSEEISNKLNELKIYDYLRRTAKTARQTGLALAFYNVNDGLPTQFPVMPKRIKSVIPGFILSKKYISLMGSDLSGNPIDWQPGYEVEFYKIRNSGQIWHKSRVLECKGEYLSEDMLIDNSGYHESVIDINRKAILLYDVFGDSVSNLADNVIQEVLRVEGLEDKMKTGQRDKIFNMLQTVMMSKSIVNKMVVDKKDEFAYHSANLSGYKDISQIVKEYAAMSSGIPITKLFGVSPSGSIGSQSGSYEEKNWIMDVDNYQAEELKPEFEKVLSWIKPLLKMSESEKILFTFPSLAPVDRKTEAEIRNIQASTDAIYIDKNIVSREEIRNSRFSGKWNINTQIDLSKLPDNNDSDNKDNE
jgi:phage-related protein (TIGR01555 family)